MNVCNTVSKVYDHMRVPVFTTQCHWALVSRLTRGNVALVDLENMNNVRTIIPRIRGLNSYIIYVSVPMTLPKSAQDTRHDIMHFIHPHAIREGSDHVITALGTFLHTCGEFNIQVISNDKMVGAANAAINMFKHGARGGVH